MSQGTCTRHDERHEWTAERARAAAGCRPRPNNVDEDERYQYVVWHVYTSRYSHKNVYDYVALAASFWLDNSCCLRYAASQVSRAVEHAARRLRPWSSWLAW